MMLKTITVLFFLAACAAIPIDEPKDLDGAKPPLLDPQAPQPLEDGTDLKTDSTYWGGYYGFHGYPIHRRSYHAYRPGYYHHYPSYHTYPSYYWGSYW